MASNPTPMSASDGDDPSCHLSDEEIIAAAIKHHKEQRMNTYYMSGFAYPSKVNPLVWVKRAWTVGEGDMQIFAYNQLNALPDDARQNIRIPKVFRVIVRPDEEFFPKPSVGEEFTSAGESNETDDATGCAERGENEGGESEKDENDHEEYPDYDEDDKDDKDNKRTPFKENIALIVMEYIDGQALDSIWEKSTANYTDDFLEHLEALEAKAISLFIDFPVPPNPTAPGQGKDIHIHHPVFWPDYEANRSFASVADLENTFNKIVALRNRGRGTPPKMTFLQERMCFCYAYIGGDNFMYAHDNLYVVGFRYAGFFPISFMTYVLQRLPDEFRKRLPPKEGIEYDSLNIWLMAKTRPIPMLYPHFD